MKPTNAFGALLRLERPIIETREAAVRLGLSTARASQLLRSLEEGAARGGRVLLPEIELPEGFEERELEGWIGRIPRRRLRTLVSRALARVVAAAARSGT